MELRKKIQNPYTYPNKAFLKMKETNPNYHIPEKIIIFIFKANV